MAGPLDAVLTYQFLKKLTTPFNQMKPYAYGLIDDEGNFLKDRNKFTPDEKNILGLYDIMIINLKKLINMIPGGSVRTSTVAAATFLLNSKPLDEDLSYEQIEQFVTEGFHNVYNTISENGAVAVNSAGSGAVAGIGQPLGTYKGEPGLVAKSMERYKKKNRQSEGPILGFVKRAKDVTEDIVQGSQNALPLNTKKARRSPSTTEIIQVQNKVAEDTSLKYHHELNPKIWADGQLKPDIKAKLLEIAIKWADFTKIPQYMILDIVITGGNVNYNYTEHSDIDLHIVINRDELNPDRDFVDEYLQDKKTLWTLQHKNITIYGYPVELYAQDINEVPHVNQGVYSLVQDRWIAYPRMLDIDFENDFHLQKKVTFYMNMIDNLIDSGASDDSIDALKDRIKKMRSDSIAKEGEFAFGNLVFKDLRNAGYIDKLNDYKKDRMDKNLSLGTP